MMKFNTMMGTAVVPLLARLVLCAAFLPMGWNKLVNDHTFSGEDAQILIDLGVVEQPASGGAVGQPASFPSFLGQMRNQSSDANQEQPSDPDESVGDRVRDAAEDVEEAIEEAIKEVSPRRSGIVTRDPETGEMIVIAKRMHTVTVVIHKCDGPSPVVMGWLATLTELIGGALLLIGLFSRLWGIGLAITMAVAFYLTSWPVLTDLGLFGVAADIAGGYANFNRMFVQLALFVLAFGVFATGAGPVSIDRWLFRSSAPPKVDDDDER